MVEGKGGDLVGGEGLARTGPAAVQSGVGYLDGELLQLCHRRRQREIGPAPLAERERDPVSLAGRKPMARASMV